MYVLLTLRCYVFKVASLEIILKIILKIIFIISGNMVCTHTRLTNNAITNF